jgi:predicted amidohydrolase
MDNIGRRTVVKAGAALGVTLAAGEAAAQAQPAARPKYKAAVMRTPILVPPSGDALPDIRRKNAEAMVAAIDKAMATSDKPRLVVFPVVAYTSARRAVSGVPMSAVAVDLVSEPLDKGIFAPVIEACRRHNCYVATSTQEKVPQLPGTFFHTGFIMGPEGLVLRSPKSQAQSAPEVSYLRDIAEEYKKIFGPDSIMPVVKTPIGNLASYVEGEAEVLEASRLLASKGAEVIAHVSLEMGETPWLALKQAIGFQCHVFLLTGTTSRHIYADKPEPEWAGGSSTIIGPDGKVLAEIGGTDEGAAVAEIDLNAIAEAKKKYGRNTTPAWGLYSDLYKD